MKRGGFRFHCWLRVRWAGIDAQKIVFDGHGLMYFGTAIRRLPARVRAAISANDGGPRR